MTRLNLAQDILFMTAATPSYLPAANDLIASLTPYTSNILLRVYPDSDDWNRNCVRKPTFIRDVYDSPWVWDHFKLLVWLDADAVVRLKPALFERMAYSESDPFDIAIHTRKVKTCLASTIAFPVDERSDAGRLITEWEVRAEKDSSPFDGDQTHLAAVLPSFRHLELPSEYARIFDKSAFGEPVIEQLQHSRNHRKRRSK